MTKAEIVTSISENIDVTKSDVEAVLDDFIGLVIDELAAGNEVAYPRLGKFKVKSRPQREGRNPATGEAMTIAAKNVPAFTPSADLKRRVNGEE